MSRSVEERVVEMQFNNRDFEENIQKTLKSLEALNKSLNEDMLKATDSLKSLEDAGRSFSLYNIEQGIDTLSSRFSTLGVVGMTALQEITKEAMHLGSKIVSSVINPMIDGGKKRALNIEQAKFQFKGLGMDIEEAMKNANDAVAGTAYGLDEAAKVASQLGASGIKVGKDMTTALTGISGVAAMTSSSYEDIGRIFIKVAGNGRLMGQELLQLSGRGINAAAVIAKQMNITEEAVRDMVSKGQISFEMFYTAMESAFGEHATSANELFTGSLSNMKAALSRIGASFATPAFENFRDIFNSLRPIIDGVHASLKPFIADFNEFTRMLTVNLLAKLDNLNLDPLTPFFQGLKNLAIGVGEVLRPFKDAFNEIFQSTTTNKVMDMANSFEQFTSKLKVDSSMFESLKSSFRGFFAILDVGKGFITAMVKALVNMVGYILPINTSILSLTGTFGEALVSFRDMTVESDIFNRVFEAVGEVVKPVANIVRYAIETIVSAIQTFSRTDTSSIEEFGEKTKKGFNPLTEIANMVVGALGAVSKAMSKVAPTFNKLADIVGAGLSLVKTTVVKWIAGIDITEGFAIYNAALLAGVIKGAKTLIDKLTSVTVDVEGVVNGIKSIFGSITDTFAAMQARLKADSIKKIAVSIGIFTAAILVLSTISPTQLATSLGAIGVMLTELFGSMLIFERLSKSGGIKSVTKVTSTLLGLSTALLLLSFAMRNLSNLDWKETLIGLGAIGVLMGELVIAMQHMPNEKKLIKGAGSLIIFSAAIVILTTAVKKLASIDGNELFNGLVGIGVLLAELSIFLNATDFDGLGVLKGVGILALTTSIAVLSSAVKRLGSMDTKEIAKGIAALGIVMVELQLFLSKTKDVSKVISTAVGLTILAGALLVLSRAVNEFGQMSLSEIAKGLGTMGASLAILAIAMNSIKGGVMTAIAISMVAKSTAVLASALQILGSLSVKEIALALGALAGAFTVLGVAAAVVPIFSLMGLATALTLIAVSIGVVGAGIGVLSAGLATLAIAGTAGISALVLWFEEILTLIPTALTKLGEGLVALATTIGNSGEAIFNAFKKILESILDAIIAVIPKASEAIMLFLDTLLTNILEFIPKLIDGGMEMLLALVKGISDNIREIAKIAVTIISDFIKGVADGISKVIQAGIDLMIAFINGMADGIRGNTDTMIGAMKNLMSAIIEAGLKALKDALKFFSEAGSKLMDSGIAKGIGDKISTVVDAVKQAPTKALEALGESIIDFITAGSNIVDGLVQGITGGLDKVKEAAKGLAVGAYEAAKNFLGINSPSKLFEKHIGASIGEGMVDGMKSYIPKVELTAESLGKMSYKTASEWVAKHKELNQLSALDEVNAWEMISKKYKKNTQEKLEADKAYAAARKSLVSQMKEIDNEYVQGSKEINKKLKEDIGALIDDYRDAIASRAKSIENAFSLFDEVNLGEDVEKSSLIKNLQDQVDAIEKWASEFERLSAKGIEDGLLDELSAMGPKALKEMQALNAMTEAELKKYSALWAKKSSISYDQAEVEMGSMLVDTESKIEVLKDVAGGDLDALRDVWATKTYELTRIVADSYDDMGDDIIDGLRTLAGKSKYEFEQSNAAIKEAVGNEHWDELGNSVSDGVTQGILDGKSDMINAMIEMARAAKAAMSSELGIHSPSRVFRAIGHSIIDGLVVGTTAPKQIRVIENAMVKVADSLEIDADMAPTIRPIVDMSDVISGIESAFDKDRTLSADYSRTQARTISKIDKPRVIVEDGGGDVTNSDVVNNFVVNATVRSTDDIRKIAQELYTLQLRSGRGRGVSNAF